MVRDYDADVDEAWNDDLTPVQQMVKHALDAVGHRAFNTIDPDVESRVKSMALAFLGGTQTQHHIDNLRDMLIREHKIAAGVAIKAAKDMYQTMGRIAPEYKQDMN